MNSFRQKLGSLISLFALISNLLPPLVSPVQAREDFLTPAENVHSRPQPEIISSRKLLTSVAANAEAVMPPWFKPPVGPTVDLAAAAGLSLAKPAVIADLPDWPAPTNESTVLAAGDILPSWFKTDSRGVEEPESGGVAILPDWFNAPSVDEEIQPATDDDQRSSAGSVESSGGVLPGWFNTFPGDDILPEPDNNGRSVNVLPHWFIPDSSANSARLAASKVLPGWFIGNNQPPASPFAAPPLRPLQTAIPLSLLAIDVTGPNAASLGSPPGFGEVYTAVIRNDSSQTAYGIYLTATHQTFFVHDGGDQLITKTGSITFSSITTGPSAIVWSPGISVDLAPGEVITLNFKLRATCGAKSAQQMRIGVRYNADPPPATADELNTSGLNITTGRGNLVIRKDPAIQNLGTPDFGQPITWIVTVQNTGLGKLYNAIITDTGGISLSQPSGDLTPTTSIFMLDVNEVKTYTVVGTVEACNFTNVAQASWPCGNLVGDAVVTNPVESTASVLFTPQVPNINIQVSSPLTFPYCTPVTRTVSLTVTNTGGPAGNFRLDSTFESNGFLEVVNGSVSGDWTYNASTGIFSYTSGSPTSTIPNTGAGGPITLTFEVRPQSAYICGAGSGDVGFTPLYQDICDGNPFTGNVVNMNYQYGQGQSPSLNVAKTGPAEVSSGDIFTYIVTVSGDNPNFALGETISGDVSVADTLPSQFEIIDGPAVNAVGAVANPAVTSTQGMTLTFDPIAGGSFTVTLVYTSRAITTAGGLCGASLIVDNEVTVSADTTCPGCAPLTDNDDVDTAIENNEGVFPGQSASGSLEACGPELTIVNDYQVADATVVTWNGAAFTEALGINLGQGALPAGTPPLIYISNTLSVTIGGVDYTALLTPTLTPSGQLFIDLTPLEAAGAPTQNFTIFMTYSIAITEGSLNGNVNQQFYDWSQLFLPNFSEIQGCAGNSAFNQVLNLTIGRGDLSVGLSPQILNRCTTNTVIIDVNDNEAGRLTDHIVVTFTSSIAEIYSARNFTFTGSLATITPITITSGTIGGGRGIITFTFPESADLNGNGQITFDLDVNCTDEADWEAGIIFQSRCAFPYAHKTTRDHVYRAPNLTLFATPIRYTVRNKDVIWKFFVTNNGNLTATNVVVTNAVNGLSVVSYTADSGVGNVSISGTLPISGPPNVGVVFTISQIAPNEQREITVTAKVFLCTPLEVTITTRLDCFGTTCVELQKKIDFDTPDPYLLTNNGETADLPMCDLGEVIFTTKNASADVNLYELVITETLIHLTPEAGVPMTMTIYDDTNTPLVTTLNFTPEIQSGLTQTLLVWRPISAPTEVLTYFNELPALYLIRITVPVRTSCDPPDSPQSFAAASALGPCNNYLGYTEDALTLKTLKPDLTISKDGKGPTGNFGETIYASPGETVTWRIQVENRETQNAYVARNAVLSDTWPVNFTFVAASARIVSSPKGNNPPFTPTVMAGLRTITWYIGDIETQDIFEFLITGTVALADDACQAVTTNTTYLTFGCDDGCTSAAAPQDTANLVSRPLLDLSISPSAVPVCGGDITVRVRNNGSPAYSNTLAVTLPSNYVYSETISYNSQPTSYGPLTPSQIITGYPETSWVWDPITIPGRSGSTPYRLFLVFRIKPTSTLETCDITPNLPITATIGYNDHPTCITTTGYTTQTVRTLNLLTSQLSLDKSPSSQVSGVGQAISWTLTLSNIGIGNATEGIVVTDTVGTNFANVTATLGSDGSSPTIITAGGITTITWQLAPSFVLSAGGANVWTATIAGTVQQTGTNRNEVEARALCGAGCRYTNIASDTAFVTVHDVFSKTSQVLTGTIGDMVTFTMQAVLGDENGTYDNLIFTDTLPSGLGYLTATLNYTQDVDGASTALISSPTTAPAPLQAGNIVWNLGTVPGSINANAIIVAMILDHPTNQTGLSQTNRFVMAYDDDGGTGITQTFTFTTEDSVDIQVPVLHIQKTYVTQEGCSATLLDDNFNSGFSGWNVIAGTWISTANGIVRETSDGTNRRAFNGNTAWTDYSFSAMVRSTDTTGTIGLIFRAQNTSSDFYRWQWRRNSNGSGAMELAAPNGSVTTITSIAYEVGRWYHVEIRGEGSQGRIYVDGQLVYTTSSLNNLTGQVGLYADNQNSVEFDDLLLTRIQDTACFVGANDLVTYTLTISSHEVLPGYNLLITDNMPSELVFQSSTWSSTDSGTTNTFSPTLGATAPLTWTFNQLTGTGSAPPLVANQQTLVITVVARVTGGVAANIFFSNQTFLAYSNRSDGGLDLSGPYGIPTRTQRIDSGGSHSTGLRTVDDSITKTVTFSPPPTATLGTLVTYTIIVPSYPISANLYNLVVTDTIDSRLLVLDVISSAASGVIITNVNGLTNNLRLEISNVPSYTQAFITVTTRISHEWPNAAGDANSGETITNSAVLTHPTADQITQTNVVSTEIQEPRITITKEGSITTDPQVAVYTITVANSGTSPAYSLRITDNLPAGISVTNVSNNGVVLPGGRAISWTISFLDVPPPPNNTLALTYTARLSEVIYNGTQFTNTVVITSTSLTDTIPGVRPYTDTDRVTLNWPMGRLGDYVWYELDHDGIQGSNPGEFGINGVILELFNATTGELISTTTTYNNGPNDGFYIFEYLPLNVTYTVRISSVSYGLGGPLETYTQTLFYISPTNTLSDSNASITATFGGLGYATTTTLTTNFTEDLSLDFGFVEVVEIGNYVWFDENIDGIQNEVITNGLGGVTVTVTHPDGRVFTTTTTPGGYYTFTVPISQVYTITVVSANFAPGGPLEVYTNTLANQGGDDATDSDGQPSGGDLVTVTPVITQNNYTFDFGLVKLVALGNRVWYDLDDSGILDGSEVGVPGVAMELYQDTDGSGDYTPGVDGFISSTTTVAGGLYTFTRLLPSFSATQTYLVVVTNTNFTGGGPLVNYMNSTAVYTGNSDLNEYDHGVVNGTLGSGGFVASTPVTLIAGTEPITGTDGDGPDSNITIDFGFYQLSLGDFVWYDNNNNAQFDIGESPAATITVRLYNITGTLLANTTTDASGLYTFTGLVSGTGYIVEIVPPAGYTSSTDIPSSVNPNNNENNDDNGVNWAGNNIRSNPITLTAGYTGTLGNTTVNTNTATTHDPTVDFGLVRLVSLGNQVWYDVNNNGLLDASEVGVSGVAMELYQDTDSSGDYTPGVDTLISTTTTVAGGFYTFTNLLPTRYPTETYLVVVTNTNFTGAGPLVNYHNSDGSVSGNSDLNSQDHGVVSGTLGGGGFVASTPVSLTVNSEPDNDGDTDRNSNLTIDFGFYQLSLGDQVWFDNNNNGLIDGGETGASGITVRLYDSTGTTVLSTTTTGSSGFYTFTNLMSTTYVVEIVPPANYTSSTDIGTSPNPDNNVNSDDNGVNLTPTGTIRSNAVAMTPGYTGTMNQNTVVTSTGSTHNPTVDFGLVPLVELGNYVWHDVNRDGIQDGTDIPFQGVTVTLTYPTGVVVTTTTNASGLYTFTIPANQLYTITIIAENFNPGGPLRDFTPTTLNATNVASDSNGIPNGTLGAGGTVTTTAVITLVNNYTFDFGFFKTIDARISKDRIPISATIGQTVTYVITIPQPVITDALSTVVVTDNVPSNLISVTASIDPITSGGSITVTGNLVVVTWPVITAANQYRVIISGVLANAGPNQNGGAFTNTAQMFHRDTDSITTTTPVTVTIIEPELNIGKLATPNTGVAGDTITYTLQVSPTANSTADAFDVLISDTVPAGLNFTGSQQSSPPANSFSQVGSTLIWGFDVITQGVTVSITYTVRMSDSLQPGAVLINVATTTWTTLPGDNPDERDGSDGPGGPLDDYGDVTTESVTTGGTVTVTKQVSDPDVTRTISGTVPYSITIEVPPGTINNLLVTDTLEAGLIYNGDAVKTGSGSNPAPSVSAPNDGSVPVTLVWNFGPVVNPASNPQPIVITFTATVADRSTVTDTEQLDNDALATWTDAGGPHTITDTTPLTIEVPALVVNKTVNPTPVAPGVIITWTVSVRNVGSGMAYGVDISDTLPSTFFTYQSGSSILNGSGIADPAISGPDLFWDLNQTLTGNMAFTLTYRTVVSDLTLQGVYTNIVTATNSVDEENNPIPADNDDHVPSDNDNDDSDTSTILVTVISVTKQIATSPISPNEVTTYTISIYNPGGTFITVTVTDTLPGVFTYINNSGRVNGVPQNPASQPPPITLIWNNLGPVAPGGDLTVTFQITATTEVSGTYTNTVEAAADDGSNIVTDTGSIPVVLETHPSIVVTKTLQTVSPISQGGQVVYNLTVHNTGDTTLFNVPLTDTYNAAHLQFNSANPVQSSVGGGAILWNDLTTDFGNFTPGMVRTVVVTFTALYVAGGVTTTNSIQVTGVDTNTSVVTDIDTATVTILSPQLNLVKTVSPTTQINPGDTLTYTLCYSNSGTLTATNVVITDFIPFNTTYVSGTVTTNTGTVEFYDGTSWSITQPVTMTGLRWSVGDLAPNGTTQCVDFNVTVNMTISATQSGLSVMYSSAGWVVVQGDTTGLKIIGYTGTPTATMTPTPTPILTVTPIVTTPTITPTPGITTTPEITITATPIPVPTPPVTTTPVITVTGTPIPTITPTIQATLTPVPTLGVTITPTSVSSATVEPTETATPIATITTTATEISTAEPTLTPEAITETPAPEPTPTVEVTTDTPTPESTPTESATDTPTPEPTETPTPEPTPTLEPTAATTGQAALPPQVIPVAVAGSSDGLAQAAVWKQAQITSTNTPTVEPSPTDTPTPEPLPTPTLESTPTLASTATLEPTATETVLPPATGTIITPTNTATIEPTVTTTATVPTITPTIQITPITPAVTVTPTPGITVTVTPQITITPVITITPTLVPSATVVPTITVQPTPTITPTPVVTATPTITATPAATDTTPIASGQAIVPFDTVIVNIVNTATIRSDQTPTQTVTATKPVARVVDPAFAKSVDPTQARPGETVRFFVTIDNPASASNANATNIVVNDPLPLTVDLVDFTLSSVPAGVISNATVTTNTISTGHPTITQTVATTITVNIPVLAPGEQVFLTIRTVVNNLASPPPQTIDNSAILAFNEGAPRTSSSPPVLVPAPPDDDDDDDDDSSPRTIISPGPTVAPGAAQPATTLPVLFLPETGLREGASGAGPISGVLLLLVLLGMGTAATFSLWRRKN